MDTIKLCTGHTRMIAHRGLSGLETENSIPAFVAAANRSYYGIETDVHVTKDHRFVVIHDNTTGRVSEDCIPIETSSYALVRRILLTDRCHAAGAEEKNYCPVSDRPDLIIPSLAEYIGICKRYGKKCILELKNEFAPEDIRRMIAEIRELNYLEQVVFISFGLSNLICLRELLPEQELYYLTTDYNHLIRNDLKKYGLHLDIHYEKLTKAIVEELHREGIRINCWTCDRKEDALRLIDWGVDYITSNILE